MAEKARAKSNKESVQVGSWTHHQSYLIIALFILATSLYANTISNYYNLDDELVTNNHRLTSRGISAIPDIFTSPYYEDQMGYAYEYRPITLTTFAIEHQFVGDNPHVSHFINVFLYGLTAIFLFITLQYTFRPYEYNVMLPLVATLIFVIHPLHTEVVASIKNRDELLCLLGGLGAFYFALRYLDNRTIALWGLFLLCFATGILAKRSILPFAVIIPLAGMIFRKPQTGEILSLTIPLALLVQFFVPFYLLQNKILLSSGFILILTITYLLLHKRVSLKLTFIKITQPFIKVLTEGVEDSPHPKQTSNKSQKTKSNQIKESPTGQKSPNQHVPSFLSRNALLITALTSLLVGATGLYYDLRVLLIIGTLGISCSVFLAGEQIKNWFLLIISAFLLATALVFNNEIPAAIVFMFLIIELLVVANMKNVLLYVLAGMSLGVSIFIDPSTLGTGLIFIVFFSIYKHPYKYSLPAFGFLCLFIIIYSNKEIETLAAFLMLIGAGICLYWQTLVKRRVHVIIFFISISASLVFIEDDKPSPQLNNLRANEPTLEINNLSPHILPSDYRDLEYVENPVPHLENTSKKVAISFYSLGTYLRKMIFPHPLLYYYGYKKIPVVTMSNPYVIGSIIAYLLLTCASIFFFFKNRKILAFGIGVFLISILPFSNLVSPVAGIVGERLAYISSLGFCIALAYVLCWIFGIDLQRTKPSFQKLPTGFILLMGVLLLCGSFKTINRNTYWEDHLTLFSHDIKNLKESAQAHNLLASHLIKTSNQVRNQRKTRSMREEALKHFQSAVDIHPSFFNATFDLGRTHLLLGNRQKAKKVLQKATDINPDFATSYLKLANIYYEEEKFDKARPLYKKVIELAPHTVGAFTNLSFIYFRKAEYQKSIEVNQKALQNNPQAVNPRINLGKTYMRMNNNQKAIRYFEEAFELQPNNSNVTRALANLHQEQGNTRKFEYYKRQTRKLKGRNR